MGTLNVVVRDAIVSAAKPEVYLTADELADRFKLNRGSVGQAVLSLAARAVLIRRQRDGSRAFEYAAGPRLDFGKKFAGKKLPQKRHYKRHKRVAPKAAAPVAATPSTKADAQIGLILRLNGRADAVTMADAKALYEQLKVIFK